MNSNVLQRLSIIAGRLLLAYMFAILSMVILNILFVWCATTFDEFWTGTAQSTGFLAGYEHYEVIGLIDLVFLVLVPVFITRLYPEKTQYCIAWILGIVSVPIFTFLYQINQFMN